MIYGHDDLHLASGGLRGKDLPTASGRGWKTLDPDRRLAAIDRALGHRAQAA